DLRGRDSRLVDQGIQPQVEDAHVQEVQLREIDAPVSIEVGVLKARLTGGRWDTVLRDGPGLSRKTGPGRATHRDDTRTWDGIEPSVSLAVAIQVAEGSLASGICVQEKWGKDKRGAC